MSYASVCRGNNDIIDPPTTIEHYSPTQPAYFLQSLCPYAEKDGICEALETGRYCPYIHGDLCDLCEMPALHPMNEQQREQHRTVKIYIYEVSFSKCIFFLNRNVYVNMKLNVKKHLLYKEVKINHVVFVLK